MWWDRICGMSPCICGPQSLLHITHSRPIADITSITDVCSGDIIDPARFAIVDENYIGLVDHTCSWSPGVMCELEIVYSHGWEPDIEAQMAAGELACEFVKYCMGEQCRSDKFLSLAAGQMKRGRRQIVLTGLPLVDHWLIQANSVGSSGILDTTDYVAYSVS